MKHVFVETNYLIDLLRPLPVPDAKSLQKRVGSDVTLYLPWVAIAEAKRTLVRIIGEDLGFIDTVGKYAADEFQRGDISNVDKPIIDALNRRAKARRASDITSAPARVDVVAASATVIDPTKAVVNTLMRLFKVKSLKPFDEMVLAAVLTKAGELHQVGTNDLYFCNKNTKDFAPANQPALAGEYAACGLTFLDTFQVS